MCALVSAVFVSECSSFWRVLESVGSNRSERGGRRAHRYFPVSKEGDEDTRRGREGGRYGKKGYCVSVFLPLDYNKYKRHTLIHKRR